MFAFFFFFVDEVLHTHTCTLYMYMYAYMQVYVGLGFHLYMYVYKNKPSNHTCMCKFHSLVVRSLGKSCTYSVAVMLHNLRHSDLIRTCTTRIQGSTIDRKVAFKMHTHVQCTLNGTKVVMPKTK